MRYWAFIAHGGRNARFARRLHRKLESYSIPASIAGQAWGDEKIPTRLKPIFLDRAELSGGPDLKRTLTDHLRESRALIVLCSPAAAVSKWVDEEVSEFQNLGRQDHIVLAIVDPGPGGNPLDTMPPALLRRKNPDGSIGEVEPLAVDFLKDGFNNAKLKIIAGILGVNFDSLKQRDRHRRRLQAVAAIAASLAGIVIAFGIYLGLADRGSPVPYGDRIRHAFDQCDCSVFRPVPKQEELVAMTAPVRRALIRFELRDLEKPEEVLTHFPGRGIGGTWQLGQIVKGIADAPEASQEDLTEAKRWLELPFAPGAESIAHGVNYGWLKASPPAHPQAEAALWPILAITALLLRPEAVSDDERVKLLDHLRVAESAAWLYFSGSEGADAGGWRHLPNQTDPRQYGMYTSIVGLETSLALRRAGVPWIAPGSNDAAPAMIRSTVGYLLKTYDESPLWKYPGWRGTQESSELTPSSGLTLLAYSVLLRAEDSPERIELPASMLRHMQDRLADLAPGNLDPFSTEEDRFRTEFTDLDGTRQFGEYAWKIPWYPYAVDFAQAWMDHLQRIHAENARIVAARRVLWKLVSDAKQVMDRRAGIYRGEYLLHLDAVH